MFARCLSSLKDERVQASKILTGPPVKFEGDRKEYVEHIRKVRSPGQRAWVRVCTLWRRLVVSTSSQCGDV